eukprot:Nk52_evm1s2496 gene=Nk52_evmTU1s2496
MLLCKQSYRSVAVGVSTTAGRVALSIRAPLPPQTLKTPTSLWRNKNPLMRLYYSSSGSAGGLRGKVNSNNNMFNCNNHSNSGVGVGFGASFGLMARVLRRGFTSGRVTRRAAAEKKGSSSSSLSDVASSGQQTAVSTTRKVVEAGKTGINLAVIAAGFAIAGALFWAVFKELIFNKFSSQHIFSDALDQIRGNEQIKELMGDTIKGFGETTGRGRRRHLRPVEYIVDGVKYMRFQFYLDGERSTGTAHVEAKESSLGGFEYRYLFVEIPGQGWPSKTVVLLDNR